MPSTLVMEDPQLWDTETQVVKTEATQVAETEATLATDVKVVIRAVEAMEEGIAGMVAAVVGPMEEVVGGVALMQVRLLRQKLKPSLRTEAANDYQLISYIAISYVYYCLCSVHQYFIRSACALLCTNTS